RLSTRNSTILCEITYRLFFFSAASTTESYTLSLHDALPILPERGVRQVLEVHRRHPTGAGPGSLAGRGGQDQARGRHRDRNVHPDRKSTRLNSSHVKISYAVFCLKKKRNK